MSAVLALAATLLITNPASPLPVVSTVDVTARADVLRPGHTGRIEFDLSAPVKAVRDVIFEIDLSHLRQVQVTGISPGCLSQGGVADCAFIKIPAGGHEYVTVTLAAQPQAQGIAGAVTGMVVHGARDTRSRSVTITVAAPVAKKAPPRQSRVEATPTPPVARQQPVLAPVKSAEPVRPVHAQPLDRATRPSWLLATIIPAFLLLGLATAVRRRPS